MNGRVTTCAYFVFFCFWEFLPTLLLLCLITSKAGGVGGPPHQSNHATMTILITDWLVVSLYLQRRGMGRRASRGCRTLASSTSSTPARGTASRACRSRRARSRRARTARRPRRGPTSSARGGRTAATCSRTRRATTRTTARGPRRTSRRTLGAAAAPASAAPVSAAPALSARPRRPRRRSPRCGRPSTATASAAPRRRPAERSRKGVLHVTACDCNSRSERCVQTERVYST